MSSSPLFNRVKRRLAGDRERTSRRQAVRESFAPAYVLKPFRRGAVNVSLIIANTDRPSSSTYIRMLAPLTSPAFGERVGIEVLDRRDLQLDGQTTVCIVQRVAISDPADLQVLLEEVKRVGCLLVVDNDDAFAAITEEHPQFAELSATARVLHEVMQAADDVWLSTDALMRLHRLPGKSVVVRNTLDLDLWPRPEERPTGPTGDAPLRILYMGTKTHDADFQLIEPVFDRLHEAYPGLFEVVVVGVAKALPTSPWLHRPKLPAAAYPTFVPWLAGTGPYDVGLSPLVDSPFNRCKSDIKCLDYLALGALPLVSDVEPYQPDDLAPHIVTVANTADAWFAAIEHEIVHRVQRREGATERRRAGDQYLHDVRSVAASGTIMQARVEALRG